MQLHPNSSKSYQLIRYYTEGYPWKKSFKLAGSIYSYAEMQQALAQLKEVHPDLFKILKLRVMTSFSRVQVAAILGLKEGEFHKEMIAISNFVIRVLEEGRDLNFNSSK